MYFISSIIGESKYCSDMMEKHFNKELVITKEDNKDFESSTKCWICDNDDDVKVRDYCHISLENIEILGIEIVISVLN